MTRDLLLLYSMVDVEAVAAKRECIICAQDYLISDVHIIAFQHPILRQTKIFDGAERVTVRCHRFWNGVALLRQGLM